MSNLVFLNGKQMPIFGLGTWQSTPEEITTAIDTALEAGYRHIDTAFAYKNEAAIGNALKKWFDSGRIKREELFIVTKLPMYALRADRVAAYLDRSLADLQLSYVDLYLLHFSCGIAEKEGEFTAKTENGAVIIDNTTDHISLWRAMEAQVDAGKALSIGLSNFNARQVKRLVKESRIPPANLQVELHLYLQQRELVAFCKALDVTVCAYSPIGSPGAPKAIVGKGDGKSVPDSPMSDPVVLEIAKKHNKTPAQVLLRHIIQRGIAVIPKSINPERIRENFKVFDFNLDEEDVWRLDSLDRDKKGRLFIRYNFKGMLEHPEYPFSDPY